MTEDDDHIWEDTYQRRYEEAIHSAKERVELLSTPLAYAELSFVLQYTQHYEEAIKAVNKALELKGRRIPRMLARLATAYAKINQNQKANDLLEELKELRENSTAGSPSYFIAVIYSALGEKDLTFHWLEKAYEDHDMELVWLMTQPQFFPYHDDPRFKDLKNKIEFPN